MQSEGERGVDVRGRGGERGGDKERRGERQRERWR
jgi:hypothetical protein